LRRVCRYIGLIVAFYAGSSGVSSGACEIDRLLENRFLWPGLEEAKFLVEYPKIAPEIALFDSVHSFDALHYRLELAFPMQDSYFRGRMTLRLRVVDEVINSLTLHLMHLNADSAYVGIVPTAFERSDSTIIIDLQGNRYADDTLSITVYYHDFTTNRGYYYYERDAYTMAEPQDARWWFPCFDEPWDKATSEIYATVPEDYDVGSNGYLESVVDDPPGGTRTYHWVNDYPITTYLISLVMADYAVWNDYYVLNSADSIPILNMVYAEDSSAAAYDFDNVPAMMEIFSDMFYPYPYNKYGQAAVYPFPYGGMEHQTMTTMHRNWIRGDRSRESSIAHELAHMWWGDFVTMSDWRHIWLNEGFATYSSALFNEAFYGRDRFDQDLSNYRQYYLDDVESFGHYPLYDPEFLFGVPVYFKGAWVLHMLRGVVGDYAFFGGLHYYASLYAHGNASTGEFKEAMEIVSGLDLDWFFDEWIFGQAHPIYLYAWSYDGDGPFTVRLEIQQAQTAAPPFRMPLNLRIIAGGRTYDFTVINYREFESYDFAIPDPPDELLIDPDNRVLKEIEEITAVDSPQLSPLPVNVGLASLYPNPFNGSINVSFNVVGAPQLINISLYDISGRFVSDIAGGVYQVGLHTIRYDAGAEFKYPLASGIYIVELRSASRRDSQRITYVK